MFIFIDTLDAIQHDAKTQRRWKQGKSQGKLSWHSFFSRSKPTARPLASRLLPGILNELTANSHRNEILLMHASQLAEIGSWVAIHSSNLVFGEQEQPMLAASSYWTASKIRLQRWITTLKMFEEDIREPDPNHDPWPALEIVVQEILYSEVLTRVWSATVVTHDWYHESDELHGLAHAVYVSHVEAKNRALRILLLGQAANETAFDRMNVLRRRLERWTDLFLGQLPRGEKAANFGFDRQRVKDFNAEQRVHIGAEFENRQKVLVASFACDLLQDRVDYSANPETNREIAAGILACFPSDRFDSNGLPKSAQMIWLEKSQNDTQMLVDHLFQFEINAKVDETLIQGR
jgi:D-alanyl-D-alanine dipeptidase